jgi:5'-methylthioadenosine phosphorylase
VNHVSFADPYCPELREVSIEAGAAEGITMHGAGTVVVIQGPRFATRAESRWYRQAGWDVINMTEYPEAYLARELGLCYATVALLTDYDTGVEDDPASSPPPWRRCSPSCTPTWNGCGPCWPGRSSRSRSTWPA